MKKKSLLAVGLTLSLVLAMSTTAFATGVDPSKNVDINKNTDGTAVTLPGSPIYDTAGGKNTQTAGQSYNNANITSNDNGTTWATVNDDDALAGAADANGADINVWAKVVDSKSKIYKVDLAWGAMKFEYNSGSGQWDTTTHTYGTAGTAAWTTSYLDGTNNKVAVTNHSNNGIDAKFAYAMDGKPFNDANGVDNVTGNFFADNTKAAAAAAVLKATYTDATGATVNDVTVKDRLAGSKIALATADAYNSSATPPNATTDNKPAGARTENVFFAFSGTPDAGKGATLNNFSKVGVITVTVTPNNELPLNQPAYTAP